MTLSIGMLTFDCTDTAGLARSWSAVRSRPVAAGASEDNGEIEAAESSRPKWIFIRVPAAKKGKNHFHPNLTAEARQAEAARVVALGASRRGDFKEARIRWVALADPEGNELNIVAPPPGAGTPAGDPAAGTGPERRHGPPL